MQARELSLYVSETLPRSGIEAPKMKPQVLGTAAPGVAQIECGSCQQKLPLRLTRGDEPAAVWLCAKCNVSFVACCVKEALLKSAHLIRLDERFFDISGSPELCLSERQRAIDLASRRGGGEISDQRRSERVSQSLVVPAVRIGAGFVPEGDPFPLLVSNLSREGAGMVHSERIETEYLAIELSPSSQSPIQVILKLVRQRELTPPYYELGGEFLVRLGQSRNALNCLLAIAFVLCVSPKSASLSTARTVQAPRKAGGSVQNPRT